MRMILLLLIIFIASCGNQGNKQPGLSDKSLMAAYSKKGGEIAGLTQTELLKHVSQAMAEGGPEYAIRYCNLNALSIKDSLSRQYECEIRRIAARYRNPADKPATKEEKEQLNKFLLSHQNGETVQAEVLISGEKIAYYQPILLSMDACLKCHGDPGTDISDETMRRIDSLYPGDLATGFASGDFRGAWKITFSTPSSR